MESTLLEPETIASKPAQAPGWPRLVGRLPRTPAMRWRAALGVVLVGPLALGTSFAVLAMVVAAPTLPGQLFGAVIGALCTAATLWWLYTRLRVVCTTGRLTIDREHIRIEDGGLLTEPIVVHRSQLQGAAMGAPDLDLGWVPLLGDAHQRPNLTMLFAEPLAAPRLRRRGEQLPPPGAALTALSLHVEDPGTVADALGAWIARRPRDDDTALHVLSARRGPLRRALVSRSQRRGWIFVACGVIVPLVALLAIVDAWVLRETRPRRARVLALAGLTVFAIRIGLALTMGLGSAACGA